MLSPPASSTEPGSTFTTSTPLRTWTPRRSSAARRYALAFGFMVAPGSCRPSSTTFSSGCRSAISAADSTPVSPLPPTTTVPLPSRASRSASNSASWALLRVYAWSSTPGTADGVGHAAQPVHQRVVVQDPVVVDPHGLRVRVHRRHPAAHEPRARTLQQLRDAQLGELLPGRRHVQPQPLGEPLLRVHQGHLHVLAPLDPSRELDRRGHARVPRAQDQNAVGGGRHAGFVPCVHRFRLPALAVDDQ